MILLVYCTTKLLTSLNEIIGVLHPKTPHQSEWDYWGVVPQISSPVSMGLLGCCTPKLLTSLNGIIGVLHPNPLTSLNGIIGVLHPKPPHQSEWDYWGTAPQIHSPVSLVLLLSCYTNFLISLNWIIWVLHPKPPHQSQWDYWGAAPQNSSPV